MRLCGRVFEGRDPRRCGARRAVAPQVVRDGQRLDLEVEGGEAGRQLPARRLVLHAPTQPVGSAREVVCR